ncbi:MAG: pentapeptide repeat-containing protein [Hyphomicrobium sp.]|nr:pentapeptide repeat-containing protein [Hyphomicrobium sp.]
MMSDALRPPVEPETPVNPYTLLDAVNRASDSAHAAWLIFLVLMTYLTIAVAGVTHKDLLLDAPVSLPLLQVDIPIVQFFRFAPIVLVMLHVGLVSQLILLARETIELDKAIRLLEVSDRRQHPLRLELDNFFFVQALAGPQRSALVGMLLHGISWLTIAVLPVILLLFIQVSFLPYHDVAVTWLHRVLLLVDIILLVTIGIFLTRSETSFPAAVSACASARPVTVSITAVLFAMVGVFACFVATVPGELLDRVGHQIMKPARPSTEAKQGGVQMVSGFVVPFWQNPRDGSLMGLFYRNLVVTDTDLTQGPGTANGRPPTLRERDLKFARLDRSRLDGADLTGSDLTGASLVGASLEGVRLGCVDFSALSGSDRGTLAECVTAFETDLRRARLSGAILDGIDLTDAILSEADATGASLRGARLNGARFTDARLDKADLSGGVSARGASLVNASLQGAVLTAAEFVEADLSSADLSAAGLVQAGLEGARLGGANLTAADLSGARLHGADLSQARIAGTNFAKVSLWSTSAPPADPVSVSDFTGLSIAAADAERQKALTLPVTAVKAPEAVIDRGALSPIETRVSDPNWSGSSDERTWQAFAAPETPQPGAPDFGPRLTAYLSQLMCKPRWSNGAIATGIVRRALGPDFRGDILSIHEALRSSTCPAGPSVPPHIMEQLIKAADLARGN